MINKLDPGRDALKLANLVISFLYQLRGAREVVTKFGGQLRFTLIKKCRVVYL